MYEVKKIGEVFTSKFVGTGPSSYKKNNLPGRGLTKTEKHCFMFSGKSCLPYPQSSPACFFHNQICYIKAMNRVQAQTGSRVIALPFL